MLRCSCVIDTNVLLEIYSVHDLSAKATELHQVHGDAAAEHPELAHRRLRLADTLALVIALHEKRQTSFQLITEVMRLLKTKVPPDSTTFERAWVQLFHHFVKDLCLSDWREETFTNLGENVEGTACDTILLDVARAKGVPLITNEGNLLAGIKDRGLRKRARDCAVEVFTPGEYVARMGVEFPAASVAFGQRFLALQDDYVTGRPDAVALRENLAMIGRIFVWCFETAQKAAR